MDNTDRHVADAHGRCLGSKEILLNPISRSDPLIQMTVKVQNDIKTLFGDHIKH